MVSEKHPFISCLGIETMDLWTEKYRPQTLKEVVGNKKALDTIREFVEHHKKGKALLLHGPTGIGKTLATQIIAVETGRHLVEITASDERGKDAIEGYLSAVQTQTLFSKGKVILIDEADGISGRDRGAVQAIVKLIKVSAFPVFLIASDPWLPKLRPLRAYCTLVKMNRIPSPSIERILREIAEKEGIQVEGSALKSLARFAEGDLRAALTDLQMVSLGTTSVRLEDMESIGFRERATSLFNTLPTIFRSGKIATGRKLIFDGDKDPDEVLWWLESNAHREFAGPALGKVFDLLSRADLFRALVHKQQNWAFKGYMVDLMAAVSIHHSGEGKYVGYQPPDRIVRLGRSKQQRAQRDELCARLGKELHCSKRVARTEYLPILKLLIEQGQDPGLDESDVDIIMRMGQQV